MKKKIIIDLDILTVAFWYKRDARKGMANGFIKRVQKKEFDTHTPSFLLEYLSKWKFLELKDMIEDFYIKYTKLVTNKDVDGRIRQLKIDDRKVIQGLKKSGVKEEDALLVLFTSIFDLDYLVTFNRKHLKSKEKIINEVLRRYGIRTIKIVLPDGI